MPHEWRRQEAGPEGSAPAAELTLWPHRSLDARGFALFIGATFVLLMVPVGAHLGTVVVWVLLPFLLGALAMIWVALRASSAHSALTEILTLTPDSVSLERREPSGGVRRWSAATHWVRVRLHPDGGPVENYVTLKGGGREVEIGAFLSPEERLELRDEIERLLSSIA